MFSKVMGRLVGADCAQQNGAATKSASNKAKAIRRMVFSCSRGGVCSARAKEKCTPQALTGAGQAIEERGIDY
jgi:hypothetical protein